MPALILGSIYLIGVPVITGIFGACVPWINFNTAQTSRPRQLLGLPHERCSLTQVTCRDRLDPESKRNEKNMGVGKQPDTGEKVMAEEDKPSSPECA